MTSKPFVSRTFATLRIAEFGFLGVRVMTWRQTPRRNGEFCKAGDFDLLRILRRPFRTSWLMVGIAASVRYAPFPDNWGNGPRILANGFGVATSICNILPGSSRQRLLGQRRGFGGGFP